MAKPSVTILFAAIFCLGNLAAAENAEKSVTRSSTAKQEENQFIKLLRENRSFDRPDTVKTTFTCDMTSPRLKELSDTYDLPKIAGNGTTQEKAINLLAWLSKNVDHYGSYDNHVEQNSLALLKYAYRKGEKSAINCKALAVVLCEMLLSQGIPARTIWLMPGNPQDFDNHVVAIAYIKERDQWIFLDPSYNAYFTNDTGNILSIEQIRNAMIAGETLNLNKDAHYNGKTLAGNDPKDYIHYIAKDFFYFFSYQEESFGGRDGSRFYLCPAGFDLVGWQIANQNTRNTQFNPNPLSREKMEAQHQKIRDTTFHFISPADFWAKPEVISPAKKQGK